MHISVENAVGCQANDLSDYEIFVETYGGKTTVRFAYPSSDERNGRCFSTLELPKPVAQWLSAAISMQLAEQSKVVRVAECVDDELTESGIEDRDNPTIGDLKIDGRLYSALRSLGFTYVSQLQRLTHAQQLRLPGVGREYRRQLKDALAEFQKRASL